MKFQGALLLPNGNVVFRRVIQEGSREKTTDGTQYPLKVFQKMYPKCTIEGYDIEQGDLAKVPIKALKNALKALDAAALQQAMARDKRTTARPIYQAALDALA